MAQVKTLSVGLLALKLVWPVALKPARTEKFKCCLYGTLSINDHSYLADDENTIIFQC
jgi:hypothetical protein